MSAVGFDSSTFQYQYHSVHQTIVCFFLGLSKQLASFDDLVGCRFAVFWSGKPAYVPQGGDIWEPYEPTAGTCLLSSAY